MNATKIRSRWFPFLTWQRPDAATLKADVWAGLTVGLMVIPQGVAYAAIAGMPLVTRIYASLLPALAALQRLDTAHTSGAQATPLHESTPQA